MLWNVVLSAVVVEMPSKEMRRGSVRASIGGGEGGGAGDEKREGYQAASACALMRVADNE